MSTDRNVYKAPKKQWRKWSAVARRVFNLTYEIMTDNPDLFRHPKDPIVSKKFSSTTAWNAAWIAADHVDEALKDIANG